MIYCLYEAYRQYLELLQMPVSTTVPNVTLMALSFPLYMKPPKPCKNIKLVRSKDGWYISFYEWDDTEKKYIRQRYKGDINKQKTPKKMEERAIVVMAGLQEHYDNGFTIIKKIHKTKIINPFEGSTLLQSVDKIIEEKTKYMASNSIKHYNSMRLRLKNYLTLRQLSSIRLKEVNKELINDFRQHLLTEGMVNKTANNYFSVLRTVINQVFDRNEGVWKRNPTHGIVMLPTITRKHAAYSNEQIQEIKKECVEQKQAQLLLFIQFIFHTLARPNSEIETLKIEQIELDQERIFISGNDDKTRTDAYVDIYPPLMEAINESGILNYPPHYYIFGRTGVPGDIKVHNKHFYKKHVKVLEAVGLKNQKKRYDLYSYKHTGAISIYEQTKDINVVSRQCRHKSIDQTMVYLRDLNVFRSKDHFHKIKGF